MKKRKKKNAKNNSKVPRIVKAVIIFVLLFFFFAGCLLYSTGKWSGVERITLVLQKRSNIEHNATFQVALVSIEPEKNEATYISIPKSTYLEVPYGYGKYVASSVYKLGELDEKRKGGNLLLKSIERTFGLAVDGYFIFEDSHIILPRIEDDIDHFLRKYFTLASFVSTDFINLIDKKTNLAFIDQLKLWNSFRKIRSDQIEFFNLVNTNIVEETKLPDKTLVYEVNRDLFDVVTAESFFDSLVRAESIAIEVENATEAQGLATEFSRIIEHMGANVIMKSTSEKKKDDACVIVLNDKKNISSKIVSRLKYYFDCQVDDMFLQNESPADMKIILGESFLLL